MSSNETMPRFTTTNNPEQLTELNTLIREYYYYNSQEKFEKILTTVTGLGINRQNYQSYAYGKPLVYRFYVDYLLNNTDQS